MSISKPDPQWFQVVAHAGVSSVASDVFRKDIERAQKTCMEHEGVLIGIREIFNFDPVVGLGKATVKLDRLKPNKRRIAENLEILHEKKL